MRPNQKIVFFLSLLGLVARKFPVLLTENERRLSAKQGPAKIVDVT